MRAATHLLTLTVLTLTSLTAATFPAAAVPSSGSPLAADVRMDTAGAHQPGPRSAHHPSTPTTPTQLHSNDNPSYTKYVRLPPKVVRKYVPSDPNNPGPPGYAHRPESRS
ncbi:hypothetical protein ACFYXL_03780 [Streptomyces tsukubensis]|uniref:hypothetical protein n=1 Tax=Streptomyces tsukubensis TaxID=83656 RepID=UPI003684D78A